MTTNAAEQQLTARLAEWTAIRDDVSNAINNQHLVLTFGTASLAAVFIAGFTTSDRSAAGDLFFGAALVSIWVIAMWLAEVVRMLRGVAFCRGQEALINNLVGDSAQPALFFEHWKEQEPRRTLTWNYPSVVMVLSAAYASCAALGISRAGLTSLESWLVGVVAGLVLAGTWYGVFRELSYWIEESLGSEVARRIPQLPKARSRSRAVR